MEKIDWNWTYLSLLSINLERYGCWINWKETDFNHRIIEVSCPPNLNGQNKIVVQELLTNFNNCSTQGQNYGTRNFN